MDALVSCRTEYSFSFFWLRLFFRFYRESESTVGCISSEVGRMKAIVTVGIADAISNFLPGVCRGSGFAARLATWRRGKR